MVVTSKRGERVVIKDVVVHLSTGSASSAAPDFAISIAQAFEAHIAGIAFAYEPVIPAILMDGIPVDIIESQRAESAKAAEAAVARFDEAATRQGLSVETRALNASAAGAGEAFGRAARRFDLAVVGQAEGSKDIPDDLVIEGALFESGRPVIIVPYIQKDPLKLDRVVICWDGSRNAARAIGNAMPFLERAKKVDLLIIVNDRIKSDEITGADMGKHLARHGLNLEVKRVTAPKNVDAASAILSYVADSSADFMVMGAYGHSRLREFVLGGVTRHMLQHMTVPVLMSH
jgi:nucleotide-binding universal stress UspA family protein